MVKAGSALGLRTFVELRDDTAMMYPNSHRSHGLKRCSFHRNETHASRFRKMSSFEMCGTASVSLVGFVTYIPKGRVGLMANGMDVGSYPAKYSHEIPYAAVTNEGGTMGRKASPTSLV